MSELNMCLDLVEQEGVTYTHRLLNELPDQREMLIRNLRVRVEKAHEDAKRRLRHLAGISLDPLGGASPDPASGYPERLPLSALKGCFGEVMAGIVAETLPHFGEDGWRVPAYAFRFHSAAFHYLERLRQGASVPTAIPGRLGDDVLAFRMNERGEIVQTLVCEAKCTSSHDSSQIAEAHSKASDPILIPVDILQLIEILKDYPDENSQEWKNALQLLYNKSLDALDGYERCDLVSYVCGQRPKKSATWIAPDTPHRAYIGRRRLEAVEIHLGDVDDLVVAVYTVLESAHVNI